MLLTISPLWTAVLVILAVSIIGTLIGLLVSAFVPAPLVRMKRFLSILAGILTAVILGLLIWVLVVSGVTFSPRAPVVVSNPNASGAPSYVAPAAQPAVSSVIAPTEAYCQLGVSVLTQGVPTQSLSWDAVQLRGYMNDRLATDIQSGSAYCRTVFPTQVTLLFDSIAASLVRVDGRVVLAGNGRIETGTTFEWIYTGSAVSNGHAYIVQK